MSEQITREEVIAPEPVVAMAGVLDIDIPDDDHVPGLWHWLYLLERTPTRLLGPDGHPTSGIPAPPGPAMRRMFASGRVDTLARLRIGESARRTTSIVGEADKQGRSGPLRFVTVRHVTSQRARVVIVEEQVIVYRAPSGELEPEPGRGLPTRRPALALDVDEKLLFRFSALTYNAHRIHYDRDYCRDVEGYPGLLTHGPLQALAMAEAARAAGRTGDVSFSYRLVAPLFDDQGLFVGAADGPDGTTVTAVRDRYGRQTATGTLRAAGQ